MYTVSTLLLMAAVGRSVYWPEEVKSVNAATVTPSKLLTLTLVISRVLFSCFIKEIFDLM